MNKIIFFDHGSFMFRSIFSYEKNRTIPPTYTYFRMILANLKRIGVTPEDLIVIAVDSKKTWRKNYCKEYKAGRKEAREKHKINWDEMFKTFDDLIERMKVGSVFFPIKKLYCEADDIIAYGAVTYYKDKEIIIVSPDHDFYEILSDRVKMFSPMKKYKSKKGSYIDYRKINPSKELMKKIHYEASDGLTAKIITEKDFEIRKKIVTLQELPTDVECALKEEFDKIKHPKEYYDVRMLPHPKLHTEFENIYNQSNKIDFEECINYVPKNRKKRRIKQ